MGKSTIGENLDAVIKKVNPIPAALPRVQERVLLMLLPDGGPRTINKTIVMEYEIGPYPDGAPTDPCQVKCTEPLPPKSMMEDTETILGVSLQPVMEGDEWPDNFATRVVSIDTDAWQITFLVQRTDNPGEGWGNNLSVNTTYQIGYKLLAEEPA